MKILIVEKSNAILEELSKYHTPYDYKHNARKYACVDIDSETLCMLRLRLKIQQAPWVSDDTYVVMHHQD